MNEQEIISEELLRRIVREEVAKYLEDHKPEVVVIRENAFGHLVVQ